MKAVILLRCEGREDKGFRFCSGVENLVVDLEDLETTENYVSLIEYLNTVPKVFDKPCCKSHVVSSAICKIWEMGYIEDELYQRIADFYKFHQRCGLILCARPKASLI